MTADSALTQIKDAITRLQSPISDLPTLLPLLCSPLGSLGLLPPPFRKYNSEPLVEGTLDLAKHIPALQRALLEHVVPTWESTLAEEKKTVLLTQYFCPDPFSFTLPAAGDIALHAYSSILSLPLTEYSIKMLARLSIEYPVDRLHAAIFSTRNTDSVQKQLITWEDCLRNVAAVPAKVANAAGGIARIPPELEQKKYFENVSLRCEILIFAWSTAWIPGGPYLARNLQ
jgi:telomere length regulation protein